MSFEVLAVIAGGATASAIAGFLQGFFRKADPCEDGSLESRITRLTGALRESSRLVSEVESEIQSRQKLVVELQQDAERYEQLVSLNKEQVEAVAQTLGGELRRENKKSFWLGIAINFVFFLLGAFASWIIS